MVLGEHGEHRYYTLSKIQMAAIINSKINENVFTGLKLDGVGPVDNRHSTDYLNDHFAHFFV